MLPHTRQGSSATKLLRNCSIFSACNKRCFCKISCSWTRSFFAVSKAFSARVLVWLSSSICELNVCNLVWLLDASACNSKYCFNFCCVRSSWLSWEIFSSRSVFSCSSCCSICMTEPNSVWSCSNLSWSSAHFDCARVRSPKLCSIVWYWVMNCCNCWIWAWILWSRGWNFSVSDNCFWIAFCWSKSLEISSSIFCFCTFKGCCCASNSMHLVFSLLNSAPIKSRSWIQLRTCFKASAWVNSKSCRTLSSVSAFL